MTKPKQDSKDHFKGNRLQIRLDEQTYQILEKASRIKKESLSRFVREASLKKAQKIIKDYNTLQLTSQDWDILMDALINPPKPNDALIKAYQKYKDMR